MTNALLFIAANVLGIDDLPHAEKPEPVIFEGIFHPDSATVFSSWDDYSTWYQSRSNCGSGQWVGLLTHRSNRVTNNLEVEKALIRELEQLGIRVVPVFCYGTAEPELNTKEFDGVVDAYFSSDDHRLVIDALINLQVFILRSDTSDRSIVEQAVGKMQQLDIPVFKPVVSYGSKERWEESQQGLVLEIPWSFTVPEVQGMIEPLIIGYRDKEGKACPLLAYIKEVVQFDVKLMTRLRTRWQEDYDLHRFLIAFIMQVISNQEQDAQSIIQEIDRHVLDVNSKKY